MDPRLYALITYLMGLAVLAEVARRLDAKARAEAEG